MKLTKREFLKLSTMGSAAMLLPSAKILGANSSINIGIVGLRGKGEQHVRLFRKIPGAKIMALCDVDSDILDREVAKCNEHNEHVHTYRDVRHLLDNKDIDAVVIATPNHWHALMTIWSCQAGKDVYVEKPASHSIWEGRKMIEAARKYNRIVQTGSQYRSDEALQQVFAYIQSGHLGKIKVLHGLCYKRRKSIGKVPGPQPIPPSIDYNLWLGPAPLEPLMRKQLHYDWHWQWATGNGDIGNQGVHEMDLCRWVLGYDKLPQRVMSIGGRFGYDDDGETPNTQMAILEYSSTPVIFEVRGLPAQKNRENMDNYYGVRIGIVIKCEHGYFAGGPGGGWIYDHQGNKIKQFSSTGGEKHIENFIRAVRNKKRSDLNADIAEGHLSAALCHAANISYQLGSKKTPEYIRQSLDFTVAQNTFQRFEDHLFANWIDPKITKFLLGPQLEIDGENFYSKEVYDAGYWANTLLKDKYREPFVVPDKV